MLGKDEGRPIMLVTPCPGLVGTKRYAWNKITAMLHINSMLTELIFTTTRATRTGKHSNSLTVSVRVESVTHLSTVTATMSIFQQIAAALTPDETDRAILIQFAKEGCGTEFICFIEPSEKEMLLLLEALTELCLPANLVRYVKPIEPLESVIA